MNFQKLDIAGAFLLTDKVFQDNRGIFTETWEQKQLLEYGIKFSPSNSCLSYNIQEGTLRGLHYQQNPHHQSKLVTCAAGKLYDVILDLRKDSATYMKWQSMELSAFDGKSIYIPGGCAHGFVALNSNTVVSYLISGHYHPGAAGCIRWNDPVFQISWPLTNPILSDKDKFAPDYLA
ncbi:dTDP-4-dehydrorhamnose 3,5-epimerase [Flavitalea sp.]|nr:dTDP-4-dehydrorhamnose 3,5-epimerase [Flavitalea sp.]